MSSHRKSLTPQVLNALMALEGMRLGVVPAIDLEQYTVVRSIEIDIVHQDLELAKSSGARRAFLGEYGLGKTHMLELIQQIALKKNFVVTKVVLDAAECSPSQPKRIYSALMQNLVYPDRPPQNEGLLPLLDQAAQNDAVLKKYRSSIPKVRSIPQLKTLLATGLHLYLTPAIAYTRELSNPDTLTLPSHLGDTTLWAAHAKHLLLEWIEGRPTASSQVIDFELSLMKNHRHKIYSLLDYRPWAKIYGYVLNGIAQLTRDVGYSGLVVVIDEAEFYSLLSSQNRNFAKSLFQAWSNAVGEHQNSALPFTEENLLTGGYGIQRSLPARYSDNPGLYLVFAMTPNSEGIRVLHQALAPQFICCLSPLSAVDYLHMTKNVVTLYSFAYPAANLPEGIEQPLADIVQALSQQGTLATPRQTMKFLTEFLDIVRFAPEQVTVVIENLLKLADF